MKKKLINSTEKHIKCIKYKTNFNETESCIRSQAHFPVESRMVLLSSLGGSVEGSDSGVVVVGAEFSLSSSFQLKLGEQRLIPPSENRQRWMGKMGYQFQVDKHCPYPLQDLSN